MVTYPLNVWVIVVKAFQPPLRSNKDNKNACISIVNWSKLTQIIIMVTSLLSSIWLISKGDLNSKVLTVAFNLQLCTLYRCD